MQVVGLFSTKGVFAKGSSLPCVLLLSSHGLAIHDLIWSYLTTTQHAIYLL